MEARLDQALLSTEDLARVFRVTPATARRWRRLGRVHGVRVGRRWWFRRADVERLLGLSGMQ